MIDASLFLFYVDPLLDWNPKSCGDDGSALNLDDFFYFFGEKRRRWFDPQLGRFFLFFRRMLFEEKS